jgi:hypothetical protein
LDSPADDAVSLLLLAARLDNEGRPFVAAAARQAAAAARDGQDIHAATLRRQAIEVALRLDTIGLPDEAQTIFDEVVRRATKAEGAMPDRMFQAWLEAIEVQFPRSGPPEPAS